MEASGVFKAFKMQTNYRSNQEILDVANTTLSTIEANQFAKLQLRANSLAPVTSDSLQEKVSIEYHNCENLNEFMNTILPLVVRDSIVPYIQKNIAKGEKTAILAYQNSMVAKIQKHLENFFDPDIMVNIAPAKIFDSTLFSAYIYRYGEKIEHMQLSADPKSGVLNPVAGQIQTHILKDHVLTSLVGQKNMAKQQSKLCDFVATWYAENKDTLLDEQALYNKKRISKQELIERIKQNMLDFEIKRNRARQSVLQKANNERKTSEAAQNASILLSTIHSAKGLEFDNVVVIYQSTNNMSEERKRMYYVALTRAMNSELVISYASKLRMCPLRSRYVDLINDHREKEGKLLIDEYGNEIVPDTPKK